LRKLDLANQNLERRNRDGTLENQESNIKEQNYKSKIKVWITAYSASLRAAKKVLFWPFFS